LTSCAIERAEGMMDARKDIALVGNGPITEDYRSFISEHEIVVRMNLCANLDKTGDKTDFIALVNSGRSVMVIFDNAEALEPARRNCKKIWIVRHTSVVASLKKNFFYNKDDPYEGRDFSFRIARKFAPTPCEMFEANIWEDASRIILAHGGDNKQPSTGLLTFLRLQELYPGKIVNLFGFTHEGWEGHPWDAEKKFFGSHPVVRYF
jgi:hypothetical protein